MGKPEGSYIRQYFALAPNGNFSVSDEHGNSYSFTIPITTSGVSTSTLVGNSTDAIQDTRVTAGPIQLADVKLTFSVYREFCQPAGVRLEITGTENWGPTARGTISLEFDRVPRSIKEDGAWFGNSSGVALGFDWSDSDPLSPSFSSSTKTLSYTVGPSFTIDPVTTASGAYLSTAWGYQGHVFYAQGLYWVFYSNGTRYVYRTSPDGFSWGSAVSIRPQIWSGGGFSVWYDKPSNAIYYAVATNAQNFSYRYGTLTSSGTINWSASEALVTTQCS
jgi:hypothetical protein